jgi:carboxypeptidase C (cathepsin A)
MAVTQNEVEKGAGVRARKPGRLMGLTCWLILATGLSTPAGAQTTGLAGPAGAETARPSTRVPEDHPTVMTRHQATIRGKALSYCARAGFLPLRDEFQETRAQVFHVSYTLDRGNDPSPRPLTFAWNGGPGSPASLLHLGALGPRRAKSASEYAAPPPPYQLTDNESTWLEFTDLVLVDPVGTGYSFAAKPGYAKLFWNPQGDIDSIAEFIRIYLTRYDAGDAPLFLLGESYGTLRAAGVVEVLQRRQIPVQGVLLISSVLQTGRIPGPNDLPYVLSLPSYTAAAFAHQKLEPSLMTDLPRTLRQAEDWSVNQYSVALLKGDHLSEEERNAVATELARFTGLEKALAEKYNLRIGRDDYARQLLHDRGQMVAHYDSRMSGKAMDGPYDPTADVSLRSNGISFLIVPYLRRELNFQRDAFYAGPFGGGWPPAATPRGDWMSQRFDWGTGLDTSQALRRAMTNDPELKLFLASGYFDLATPYFASDYAASHLGLAPHLRKNIVFARYPAGHAVYLDDKVRPQLRNDAEAFIQDALGAHRANRPSRQPR